MSTRGRDIPDEEDGNPFLTLGQLLGIKVSVGTLASAIEQQGVYTWDRFGRFGKANSSDIERALSLLAAQYRWEADVEASFRDDPRSPLEQSEGDWDNPFDGFGWAAEVAPNFDDIRQTQTEAEPIRPGRTRRKAPDAFVAAFIKLVVELAKRDASLDVDAMPGIKTDLHAIAIKFDERLDHPISTFDTYIEGLCKFKPGSRSNSYYESLFPDFFN